MQLGIVLPVKSHIRKFIIRRYGDGQTNEIHVRQRSYLGTLLGLALVKNPTLDIVITKPTTPHLLLYYSTSTKLLELSPNKSKLLADALERHFRDSLISFVMGFHYSTGQQMQAVKQFLQAHNIEEDDLAADTAWKIWRDFEAQMERNRQKNFKSSVGTPRGFVGKTSVSSVFEAV